MEYKFVKRPNYVTYGEDKSVEEIFCKVCGSPIAGMRARSAGRRLTRDRQWVELVEIRFRRLSNYTDLKIQFEDGSYHVTNGCKNCLSENLTIEQMTELHVADMLLEDWPGRDLQITRVPLQVVAIRRDGGGIL